jgi:hypothetical protein
LKQKYDLNRFYKNENTNLFVKKSNDEGSEFYYLGNVEPLLESFEESTIKDDNQKDVSVVKIDFRLETTMDENLYSYITEL